jgi:hypothetical protein
MIARSNPFRSERIDTLRYRLRDTTWSDLLARFHDHGRRGVLVGPHGSGKTTLCTDITEDLRRHGWHIHSVMLHDDVPPDRRALDALPSHADTIVVIDGLDRLGPWTWWRLRRRLRLAGGILATSHRPGRLPTLHRHATDPSLLAHLVEELAPGLVPIARIHDLFDRHRGNLRDCLRELYDAAAS